MFIHKRTNGKLQGYYDKKRVAFTLGHAGVSQRDIICEERQNESVRGIGKAAEKRRGKNVRARRLIMFEMDQPKL